MKLRDKLVFWSIVGLIVIFAAGLRYFFDLPVTTIDAISLIISPLGLFGFLYFSQTSLHLRGKTYRPPKGVYQSPGKNIVLWVFRVALPILIAFLFYHGLSDPFKKFGSINGNAHGYTFVLYGLVLLAMLFQISGLDQYVARNARERKHSNPTKA